MKTKFQMPSYTDSVSSDSWYGIQMVRILFEAVSQILVLRLIIWGNLQNITIQLPNWYIKKHIKKSEKHLNIYKVSEIILIQVWWFGKKQTYMTKKYIAKN